MNEGTGTAIVDAVKALAHAKGVTCTQAKIEILEACAAGLIEARWRGHYAGMSPLIERQKWAGADMDLSDGVVILADGTRMALVDVDKASLAELTARHSAPPRGQRYSADDALVREGVAGVREGRWPNAHQAANALAPAASGNSPRQKIDRLGRKIRAALGN